MQTTLSNIDYTSAMLNTPYDFYHPQTSYDVGNPYVYGPQAEWPMFSDLDVTQGTSYLNYHYDHNPNYNYPYNYDGAVAEAGPSTGFASISQQAMAGVEAQGPAHAPAPALISAPTMMADVPSSVWDSLSSLDFMPTDPSTSTFDYEYNSQLPVPMDNAPATHAPDVPNTPLDVNVFDSAGNINPMANLNQAHCNGHAHIDAADPVLSTITSAILNLEIGSSPSDTARRHGRNENVKANVKKTLKLSPKQKAPRKVQSSSSRAAKAAGVKAVKMLPLLAIATSSRRSQEASSHDCARDDLIATQDEFQCYVNEAISRGEGTPRCAFENCADAITSIKDLVGHLQSRHDIERSNSDVPVRCRIQGCGQYVKPKDGNLIRHYKSHVLEVVCPHPKCGVKVARSNQMKTHVGSRHKVSFSRFATTFIPQ